MGQAITKPFAWLMRWLYSLTGNYGVSVILFALAVNLILAPFMAKSKKSMMRTTRLQPMIQELQTRHAGNQQKLNEEMQKLYREEGINPMSGCLWSLIPFPILIALYSVIRQPLSRMMFIATDTVEEIKNFLITAGLYVEPAKTDAYYEITLTDLVHNNWDAFTAKFGEVEGMIERAIDFKFLGINLGDRPWDQFKLAWNGEITEWLPLFGLLIIPFVSAFLSWLSMKVSTASNPQQAQDAQTQATNKSMQLTMPLMSIWICFIMPAAMGVYWIANSVFGMLRDIILTKIFKKQLDKEDAERIARRSAREKELEDKRLETERLRQEGKTEKNTSTSKKKIQAAEKQKADERKAALDRAERAARRERLGIAENEIPASQVGNRKYARGRAYVADRFSNPENAEAATILAAAASEGDSSIDESVVEETAAVEETAVEETAVEETAAVTEEAPAETAEGAEE